MAFRRALLSSVLLLALPVHVVGQQPYHDWAKAYAAAEALVGNWTREELANASGFNGNAPGYFPFTAKDGPMGVNGARGVSGWVAAQTIAASWDTDLVEKQHAAMAREFRSKGYSMQLGPITGPMGRSPLGGRNFESFLYQDVKVHWALQASNCMTKPGFGIAIKGVQEQGVIACGKHFIAPQNPMGRSSTNMDDRTLHELYLWPWVDGVVNGMGAAMCIMNRVNGTMGCENDYILNQVLKKEVGFKGLVVPDATAVINSTAALLHGLDWNSGLSQAAILALMNNGTIPEEVMREHAVRIVAAQLNYNAPQSEYPDIRAAVDRNVREAESAPLIRTAAGQSIVLLKNTDRVLPLKNVTSVAVFGADAIQSVAGPAMVPNVYDYQGEVYAGHLASGGGSGATPMPYLVDPPGRAQRPGRGRDGLQRPSRCGGQLQRAAARRWELGRRWSGPFGVGYCIVFINAFAKEGADRRTLADETGDKLVNDVARYCANTIVVINNVGIRLVDAWIENPNVTAVLNAGALGQESGNAIMDVLFGDVNPSGKLVYTIAKKLDDYNGKICGCCDCDYTEGVYTDYRHFDQAGIEPRYEFGYGLSYTEFTYGNLSLTKKSSEGSPLAPYASGEPADGGPRDLFDELVTLSATITNSGAVAGAEVAQLYLAFPESAKSPVRQLRGFHKIPLKPAETQTITFTLNRRDMSFWDTVAQKWKIEAGTYTAQLGKSSRDIVSEVEFQLAIANAT
ncbi:hypothetical protein PG989_006740 [Apiospora arundinis]